MTTLETILDGIQDYSTVGYYYGITDIPIITQNDCTIILDLGTELSDAQYNFDTIQNAIDNSNDDELSVICIQDGNYAIHIGRGNDYHPLHINKSNVILTGLGDVTLNFHRGSDYPHPNQSSIIINKGEYVGWHYDIDFDDVLNIGSEYITVPNIEEDVQVGDIINIKVVPSWDLISYYNMYEFTGEQYSWGPEEHLLAIREVSSVDGDNIYLDVPLRFPMSTRIFDSMRIEVVTPKMLENVGISNLKLTDATSGSYHHYWEYEYYCNGNPDVTTCNANTIGDACSTSDGPTGICTVAGHKTDSIYLIEMEDCVNCFITGISTTDYLGQESTGGNIPPGEFTSQLESATTTLFDYFYPNGDCSCDLTFATAAYQTDFSIDPGGPAYYEEGNPNRLGTNCFEHIVTNTCQDYGEDRPTFQNRVGDRYNETGTALETTYGCKTLHGNCLGVSAWSRMCGGSCLGGQSDYQYPFRHDYFGGPDAPYCPYTHNDMPDECNEYYHSSQWWNDLDHLPPDAVPMWEDISDRNSRFLTRPMMVSWATWTPYNLSGGNCMGMVCSPNNCQPTGCVIGDDFTIQPGPKGYAEHPDLPNIIDSIYSCFAHCQCDCDLTTSKRFYRVNPTSTMVQDTFDYLMQDITPHSDAHNVENEIRHIASNGIKIIHSKNVTISNVVIKNPINRGSGNNGTLFFIDKSSEVLVRNCTGYRGKHNFAIGGWGTSGIVFDKIHSEGAWAFGVDIEFFANIGINIGTEANLTGYTFPDGVKTTYPKLQHPEVNEASGLVASRTNEGLFWTHNDSGDYANLYLFDINGEHKMKYQLSFIDGSISEGAPPEGWWSGGPNFGQFPNLTMCGACLPYGSFAEPCNAGMSCETHPGTFDVGICMPDGSYESYVDCGFEWNLPDIDDGVVPNSVSNIDFEDIAIGSDADNINTYLYVGDIGDNGNTRQTARVYKCLEPTWDSSDGNAPGLDDDEFIHNALTLPCNVIEFKYKDSEGNILSSLDDERDAETLLLDPTGDHNLYIVSKQAEKVKVYELQNPTTFDYENYPEFFAQEVATLNLYPEDDFEINILDESYSVEVPHHPLLHITGGDISADGTNILIKSYLHMFHWTRNQGQTIPEALTTNMEPIYDENLTLIGHRPYKLPYSLEPQGESVAFSNTGLNYYTISEEDSLVNQYTAKSPWKSLMSADADYWSRYQQLEIPAIYFGYPGTNGALSSFSNAILLNDSTISDNWTSNNVKGIGVLQNSRLTAGHSAINSTYWNTHGNAANTTWQTMSVPGTSDLISFQPDSYYYNYPYDYGGLIVGTDNINVFTDVNNPFEYVHNMNTYLEDFFGTSYAGEEWTYVGCAETLEPCVYDTDCSGAQQCTEVTINTGDYVDNFPHMWGFFEIARRTLLGTFSAELDSTQVWNDMYNSAYNCYVAGRDYQMYPADSDNTDGMYSSCYQSNCFDMSQLGECKDNGGLLLFSNDHYGQEAAFDWTVEGLLRFGGAGVYLTNLSWNPNVDINFNKNMDINVSVSLNNFSAAIKLYLWHAGTNTNSNLPLSIPEIKWQQHFRAIYDGNVLVGYQKTGTADIYISEADSINFDIDFMDFLNEVTFVLIVLGSLGLSWLGALVPGWLTAIGSAAFLAGYEQFCDDQGGGNYNPENCLEYVFSAGIREYLLDTLDGKISKIIEKELLENDYILNIMEWVTGSETQNHLGFLGTTNDTATEVEDGSFVGDRVEFKDEEIPVVPDLYQYQSEGVLSDLTGDGIFNVVDLVSMISHIMGTDPLDSQQAVLVDFNKDGIVNVVDLIWGAQIALGYADWPCPSYNWDILGVCDGGCISDADGDGVCDEYEPGKTGTVDECVGEYDNCGVCNGDNYFYESFTTPCTPDGSNPNCVNTSQTNYGTCDCNGNVYDCTGVCGGTNTDCLMVCACLPCSAEQDGSIPESCIEEFGLFNENGEYNGGYGTNRVSDIYGEILSAGYVFATGVSDCYDFYDHDTTRCNQICQDKGQAGYSGMRKALNYEFNGAPSLTTFCISTTEPDAAFNRFINDEFPFQCEDNLNCGNLEYCEENQYNNHRYSSDWWVENGPRATCWRYDSGYHYDCLNMNSFYDNDYLSVNCATSGLGWAGTPPTDSRGYSSDTGQLTPHKELSNKLKPKKSKIKNMSLNESMKLSERITELFNTDLPTPVEKEYLNKIIKNIDNRVKLLKQKQKPPKRNLTLGNEGPKEKFEKALKYNADKEIKKLKRKYWDPYYTDRVGIPGQEVELLDDGGVRSQYCTGYCHFTYDIPGPNNLQDYFWPCCDDCTCDCYITPHEPGTANCPDSIPCIPGVNPNCPAGTMGKPWPYCGEDASPIGDNCSNGPQDICPTSCDFEADYYNWINNGILGNCCISYAGDDQSPESCNDYACWSNCGYCQGRKAECGDCTTSHFDWEDFYIGPHCNCNTSTQCAGGWTSDMVSATEGSTSASARWYKMIYAGETCQQVSLPEGYEEVSEYIRHPYTNNLVMSEIKWRPTRGEFIEIHNRFPVAINIEGFEINAIKWGTANGSVGYGLPDITIPANDYIVLCNDPTYHSWEEICTDREWIETYCPQCNFTSMNCQDKYDCMTTAGCVIPGFAYNDLDGQGKSCYQWPQPNAGHSGGGSTCYGAECKSFAWGGPQFTDLPANTNPGSQPSQAFDTIDLVGYDCENNPTNCNCPGQSTCNSTGALSNSGETIKFTDSFRSQQSDWCLTDDCNNYGQIESLIHAVRLQDFAVTWDGTQIGTGNGLFDDCVYYTETDGIGSQCYYDGGGMSEDWPVYCLFDDVSGNTDDCWPQWYDINNPDIAGPLDVGEYHSDQNNDKWHHSIQLRREGWEDRGNCFYMPCVENDSLLDDTFDNNYEEYTYAKLDANVQKYLPWAIISGTGFNDSDCMVCPNMFFDSLSSLYARELSQNSIASKGPFWHPDSVGTDSISSPWPSPSTNYVTRNGGPTAISQYYHSSFFWQLSRFRGGTPGGHPNQYTLGCTDNTADNYSPGQYIFHNGDLIWSGVRENNNDCDYATIDHFDITGDGVVNVVDIVSLVTCLLSGEICPDNYDLNQDNSFNVTDIVYLVNTILGRPTSLSLDEINMLNDALQQLLRFPLSVKQTQDITHNLNLLNGINKVNKDASDDKSHLIKKIQYLNGTSDGKYSPQQLEKTDVLELKRIIRILESKHRIKIENIAKDSLNPIDVHNSKMRREIDSYDTYIELQPLGWHFINVMQDFTFADNYIYTTHKWGPDNVVINKLNIDGTSNEIIEAQGVDWLGHGQGLSYHNNALWGGTWDHGKGVVKFDPNNLYYGDDVKQEVQMFESPKGQSTTAQISYDGRHLIGYSRDNNYQGYISIWQESGALYAGCDVNMTNCEQDKWVELNTFPIGRIGQGTSQQQNYNYIPNEQTEYLPYPQGIASADGKVYIIFGNNGLHTNNILRTYDFNGNLLEEIVLEAGREWAVGLVNSSDECQNYVWEPEGLDFRNNNGAVELWAGIIGNHNIADCPEDCNGEECGDILSYPNCDHGGRHIEGVWPEDLETWSYRRKRLYKIKDFINFGAGAGDVNLDGTVNIQDVTLITQGILGGYTSLLVGQHLENADMNNDGIINVVDVVAIINILLSQGMLQSGEASRLIKRIQNRRR